MTDNVKPNSAQGGNFNGEPPGPELAKGPTQDRVCRDVICCLVFVAFWAAFIAVTIWGLANGNPETIGRGYDSSGKLCGYSEGYEDYPLLYIAIPTRKYFNHSLCVASCPDATTSVLDCKTNEEFTTCIPEYTDQSKLSENLKVADPTGKIYLYSTSPFLSRYCIPSSLENIPGLEEVTNQLMNSDTLEGWVSDIRKCWGVILGMAGVAFLLGFVYMILLRHCAGVMTWLSIIGVISALAVLGGLYYTGANNMKAMVATYKTSGGSANSIENSTTSRRVLAYICWGIAGIILLGVICLFGRIKLAIAILKAAADYVKANPFIFLVPPVMLILLLAFYAYSGITAIYLFSSGEPAQASGLPVGSYTYTPTQKRLIIYVLFGILWGNAFLLACTVFIIASSVCIWYFEQPDHHNTIRKSVRRLWRYHLGSIAFGSFILAVVQMIRLILTYIDQQAKKSAASENKVVKFLLKCAKCAVWCFEKCIRFLNRNAYIQIALTGKNFCAAAKDAFFLIIHNPLRFGVTQGIGALMILFGKIFIASMATLIGYIIIQNAAAYKDSVESPLFPSLCIFIIAWTIGALFLQVFGLASDTILACFVVEEELRAKDPSLPLHCPASMREFVDKNKK